MKRVAVLFLTPKCNMDCDFCGAEAGFEPMTQVQAMDLLESLAGQGVRNVVLGGGEPFLWKGNLFHLARHARRLGMLVQVGSNGTLAPPEDAALHVFDRWVLPMEALSREVHDALRHYGGGHLQRIVHLMERLKREGVEVTISSLVTRENFDSLVEVGGYLDYYKRSGGRLHAWHLYKFLPLGRGGRLHEERFATRDGVFDALGELIKKRFPDLTIYLRPDMYHSKCVSFHWSDKGEIKSLGAASCMTQVMERSKA